MAAAAGTQNLNSAVFSPDGSRLVTASWDGTARVWHVDDTATRYAWTQTSVRKFFVRIPDRHDTNTKHASKLTGDGSKTDDGSKKVPVAVRRPLHGRHSPTCADAAGALRRIRPARPHELEKKR